MRVGVWVAIMLGGGWTVMTWLLWSLEVMLAGGWLQSHLLALPSEHLRALRHWPAAVPGTCCRFETARRQRLQQAASSQCF